MTGVKGFEMKLKIRPIIKEDLEVLNKKLKIENVPTLHEDKLKEQEQGGSVWLIAWIDDKPIAHGQIRFNGSKAKEVRNKMKNCPHLESLHVKEGFRKKGIATQFMNFSEKLVKQKGFNKIGLSVEKDDEFLINLYKKRGYKDWQKGIITETWEELHNRKKKKIIEKCKYLIKKLK